MPGHTHDIEREHLCIVHQNISQEPDSMPCITPCLLVRLFIISEMIWLDELPVGASDPQCRIS